MRQAVIQERTEKWLVARNFNAAADRYNSVAILQNTIAEQMYERLQLIRSTPGRVLDLGSGTGTAARRLAKLYRKARIVQVDIARQMLMNSCRSTRWFDRRQAFVCADAIRLPFASGAFDMIFSNLMLQWCNDLTAVFTEIRRVLKAGGVLMFSSFGPGTLRELKASWSAVDDDIHVNDFIDMHDVGDTLVRAGFEHPVLESENFTLTYPAVEGLYRDLKLLGAGNANTGRRRTLTGKGRLRKVMAAYEKFRSDDVLPATYEAIYGHAWCGPDGSGSGQEKGTYAVPVASVRRSGR